MKQSDSENSEYDSPPPRAHRRLPYAGAGTGARRGAGTGARHDDPSPFKALLKHYRKAGEMRQEDLAQRLDYAPATIQKWEQGQTVPAADVMDRLVGVLGLGAEDAARLRMAAERTRAELAATRAMTRGAARVDATAGRAEARGDKEQGGLRRPLALLSGLLILVVVAIGVALLAPLVAGPRAVSAPSPHPSAGLAHASNGPLLAVPTVLAANQPGWRTSLRNGAMVPQYGRLVVTYPVADTGPIWVLLRQDNTLFFPLAGHVPAPCRFEPPLTTAGRFVQPIRVGEYGKEWIGRKALLVVMRATQGASQELADTLHLWCAANNDRGDYRGLTLEELPPGLTPVAQVAVTRIGLGRP